MFLTESDLRPGEMVFLRRHTSGCLCLVVEREGRRRTLRRFDGTVWLFDGEGEVELFCRARKVTLKKLRLSSGPKINPRRPSGGLRIIREAFVEAIKKQAEKDLKEFTQLLIKLIQLNKELQQYHQCPSYRGRLERIIEILEERMATILLWWFDTLETTPGDVVAGRWSPDI